MTQMTIGYSDTEDRLWFLLSDDEQQFWLSRRFSANLLKHMEQALTDSCPGAGLHVSMDARTRVALEHQAAVEQEPDSAVATQNALASAAASSAIQQGQRHAVLLSSILLTADAHHLQFEMITAHHSRTLRLSRAEAHQLLAAIWQFCQMAKWGLQVPSCLIGAH